LARDAIAAAQRTNDLNVLLDVIHAAGSAMQDLADPLEPNRPRFALPFLPYSTFPLALVVPLQSDKALC